MPKEIVKSASSVLPMDLDGGGIIRWLVTHRDGAPNFSMRLIDVPAGKSTPDHSHDYEHEMYFIEGNAEAVIEGRKYEVTGNYFLYVPPNFRHKVTALTDIKLICVVPIKAAISILGP
ncbi:MAG: cupin domain-containing protein [Thermoplasmatales archaeon]